MERADLKDPFALDGSSCAWSGSIRHRPRRRPQIGALMKRLGKEPRFVAACA
jgi:hypothetical protein